MNHQEYILGVDYGAKRVGLALAHKVARLPRPFTTLPNDEGLTEAIARVVEQEGVGLVVVGLPRTLSGGYSHQTHDAAAFAEKLAAQLPIPVITADETLTSVDATAQLEGTSYTREMVDAAAASLILERYLAESRPEEQV